MMGNAILIFMGVGASGKTTIANALAEKNNKFVRVSSGDIIREYHASLTDVDRQEDEEWIAKYGLSKYNDVIKERIFAKIKEVSGENKIPVLDGYPRTIEQFINLTNTDYKFIIIKFDIHIVVALKRMEDRNRDEYIDSETILKAQYKLMQNTDRFIEDYKHSANGYKIPTLELDTTLCKEGDTDDATACVESFYNYYNNIISEVG